MADENTRRSYQSNVSYPQGGQAPGASRRSSDPLAELARLIGQSDPYTDLGQNVPRRAESPQSLPEAAPMDWRQAVAAMPPFENLHPEAEEPSPRHGSHHSDFDRSREPYFPAPMDPLYAGRPIDNHSYDRPFPSDPQSGHYRDDGDDSRYAPLDSRHPGEHYDTSRYDDAHFDGNRQDDGRQDPGRSDGDRLSASGAFYQEGATVGPRDAAMYDDPPRARGRNGLITAATLVACAVVGTAAAYGYRTYVGSGAPKTPPIITAESTPSKVAASSEGQPNKSIQDRVREQGQERLVPREEQPVDPRGSSARLVPASPYSPPASFPSPSGGGTQTPAGSAPRGGQQPSAGAGASSGGGLGEPKSIRTIPIRPDGNDLSGRPITGMTPPPQPTRPATPPPKNTQSARANGPVSLDPQTTNSTSAREREFNAPPPTVPDQPRLASAPTNAAPATSLTGQFMVQLSSQKSEGEAQATFRSLRAKYPDQLGGRSPVVRRADLGDKGVYYRTMVGPFGSSDEATRFCSGLKAAGGNCLIQRN